MLGFLRRRSPRNPVLSALYWVALAVVVVSVVFLLFYLLEVDRLVPGGGMF